MTKKTLGRIFYCTYCTILFYLFVFFPLPEIFGKDLTLGELVEKDWLKQAESWRAVSQGISSDLTTRQDAAGAVDGLKNGKFGFHTGKNANPWWQVDLGSVVPITRIVVYNRLDYASGLHLADAMQILISNDAAHWTLLHDCGGKHFGGVEGTKPLELNVEQGKAAARYVRLVIPSTTPIFFHLDEVEIYSFDDPSKNIAFKKPADQISLSNWSTVHVSLEESEEWKNRFPITETRTRIGQLLDYLATQGVNTAELKQELDQPALADVQAEYLRLRRLGRRAGFMNPLLDFNRLLFVKRYTQQTYPDICLNHMPWVSRPGGDICILENPFVVAVDDSAKDSETKVVSLLNGRLGQGHVRGIDLWFDGDRIVFGYAKQGNFPFDSWPPPVQQERLIGHDLRLSQEPIHLFEVNTDGSGLRQITDHEMWSDLDPAYLPNGNIVFVSERCGFSLQCNNGPHHDETSCNLFSVKPDGTDLRWLSYNKDGDYQPHVLNDGTIGYCRWEYQERGWANIQSVWFIHPDGTGADALFKQHLDNPWALENTREIPSTTSGHRRFVSIAAGHHTLASGPVCILSPEKGLNAESSIEILTPGVLPPEGGMSGKPVAQGGCVENGGYYMYPWPLSEKFFLASYSYSNEHRSGSPKSFRGSDENGYGLYLLDVFGNKELIYADPEISSSFPMPLRSRPKPPILADNCRPEFGERAHCFLSDVTFGVEGVKREEVKYLRIARRIGWPYTKESGGQRYEVDGSSWGLSWAPALIFGEVPVEPDGSASFWVPANVSVYFQLLDAEKREIKRMRSFISFQPGESRSCVGCHETREVAPAPASAMMAMEREPSTPESPPWGSDRCINYRTDIQPVLDKHCVSCHSGLKPAAKLDFSGGLTASAPMKTPYRSFNFDGLNRSYRTIIENNLVTYSYKHAPASELTQTRQFGSTRSRLIDAILSGPCASHIDLKPGSEDWYRLVTWIDANVPYHDRFVNSRPDHPVYDLPADEKVRAEIVKVHQNRCAECHSVDDISRMDWIDLKAPEKSRFLTAPLASKAGGAERCGKAIYVGQNDPDYENLRKLLENAVSNAWKFPRRDLEK